MFNSSHPHSAQVWAGNDLIWQSDAQHAWHDAIELIAETCGIAPEDIETENGECAVMRADGVKFSLYVQNIGEW